MGLNRGVNLSQGVAILLLLLLAGMQWCFKTLKLRLFEPDSMSPTAQFIANTVPQKKGRQRQNPIIQVFPMQGLDWCEFVNQYCDHSALHVEPVNLQCKSVYSLALS